MSEIPFIKMQGCGNDFVIIDNRTLNFDFSKKQIQDISNRKLGVGCDQLILIGNTEIADCSMRIFNIDGSEAEACGNGTRCVAWLIMDEAYSEEARIETVSCILEAKLFEDAEVSINMGIPKTKWQDIPMMVESDTKKLDISIDDLKNPSAINIGNPHVIFFVDNLDEIEIEELGPTIENHFYFPNKTNVNFVEIIDKQTVRLRTFERGVGRTLACGTGACASVAAAINRDLTARDVKVIQDGGNLQITMHDDGNIHMRGKIDKSFVGVIEI